METVPQLPEDVIVNILSRLPVKYLIQLKCVCKPWRSLISDPRFAKLQFTQSKNIGCHRCLSFAVPPQTVGLEASGDGHNHIGHLEYPVVMKEPLYHAIFGAKVRGSCNGLICVVCCNGRIFLWNPTIREALELPNNADRRYLIFGLGYDFSVDGYKLLKARYGPHDAADFLVNDFEILALKSNKWCKVEEPELDYIFVGTLKTGIFLHRGLHVVLVLDTVEEKFYELVELPNRIEESELFWLDLISSGDSLFLFFEDICRGLEAWQLNDYGIKSSWTKIFSNIRSIPEFGFWGNVLHYTKTGKFVVDYGSRGLIWYDPKENTWQKVTLQLDSEVFQHAIYVESLILPDWYRPTNA